MRQSCPPPTDGTAAFFDAYLTRYMDAWNVADLAAILATYNTPCYVFKRGEVHLHLDDESKRAYFADLLDGTRTELALGARWSRQSLELMRLGPTSALVTVRWMFMRPDGSTVEDYLDSYHLGLSDGRWLFLGDTVHEVA